MNGKDESNNIEKSNELDTTISSSTAAAAVEAPAVTNTDAASSSNVRRNLIVELEPDPFNINGGFVTGDVDFIPAMSPFNTKTSRSSSYEDMFGTFDGNSDRNKTRWLSIGQVIVEHHNRQLDLEDNMFGKNATSIEHADLLDELVQQCELFVNYCMLYRYILLMLWILYR